MFGRLRGFGESARDRLPYTLAVVLIVGHRLVLSDCELGSFRLPLLHAQHAEM